jgi:deoxyadenosine/deoxycytidine kinase
MSKYIVIEGNIGAGKTTFCQMLAAQTKSPLVLEEFSDNPFLPLFYENPERYALQVELFFMTDRFKQLHQVFQQPNPTSDFIIADYFFTKTLLFASKNLCATDFALFTKLFEITTAQIPQPDIILYLHRDTKFLLENIKKRGRTYEQQMQASYLLNIQNSYLDYFNHLTHVPIVVIDIKDTDFTIDTMAFERIKERLFGVYPKNEVYFSTLF